MKKSSSTLFFQEHVAIDRVKLLKKLRPKKTGLWLKVAGLVGKSAGFFFVSLHVFFWVASK